MNLKEPFFGTPNGQIENAAYDWLCQNVGCEGESVMKSLAEMISDAIKRERVVWDQQLGNVIDGAAGNEAALRDLIASGGIAKAP